MKIYRGYQDLLIWRLSMDLVIHIYELTNTFSEQEKFGLISQMRRCAISIPSNISEGYHRKTKTDFLRFIHIAMGSTAELDTQCLISFRLQYISELQYQKINQEINSISRLLGGFIKFLKK